MPIHRQGSVKEETFASAYPPPHNIGNGPLHCRSIGDAGGLTQFGFHQERLDPGCASSQRHWHTTEDEAVYVLSGRLTLVDDAGAHDLGPGDAATFPAGAANGHHLINQGSEAATYLIIGSRLPDEVVHYSDVDMVLTRVAGKTTFTNKDGKVLPRGT